MPDQNIIDHTAAIILAGGKSSRMGQDKALLKVNNQTILQRTIGVVEPLVSKIVVMLSLQQPLEKYQLDSNKKLLFGVDRQPEQGPLQGISDALFYLPEQCKYVFILPCDLPFISTQWLIKLQNALLRDEQLDLVCTKNDNQANPLIAIYKKETLNSAPLFRLQGKRSCLALLDDRKVYLLEPKSEEIKTVSNVNTPQEYRKATGDFD